VYTQKSDEATTFPVIIFQRIRNPITLFFHTLFKEHIVNTFPANLNIRNTCILEYYCKSEKVKGKSSPKVILHFQVFQLLLGFQLLSLHKSILIFQ